jgi:glycosyltransferase involved in cell wall biosynthesis
MMSLLSKTIIGGLGILASSIIIEKEMEEYDTIIICPIDIVSIIVSSYNESTLIETCLSSLRNQSIIQEHPSQFEIILADSCSTDGTIELANQYVDRIIITPRGKLTSRNIAAQEAKGSIIVSVDSDSYYPYHWLNTLLRPLNDDTNPKYKNVVGVFGSTFDYSIKNIPGKLFSFADFLYNSTLNTTRMVGRNSVYRKWAYILANRFDESVNQFSIWSIFSEEEMAFGKRLSKLGNIIYKPNASCYHLGGEKSIGRLGVGNKRTLEMYNFGNDRF